MEKIGGQPLSDAWHEASRAEKDRLLTQFKDIFEELRALKKPAGKGITDSAVCAADGGKLHDHRIWNAAGEKGMGPFPNEAAFNLFLRNGVSNIGSINDQDSQAEIQKLIEMHTASEQKNIETANAAEQLVKELGELRLALWTAGTSLDQVCTNKREDGDAPRLLKRWAFVLAMMVSGMDFCVLAVQV
ncbi:hypothetical protein FGADI_9111 [Fusarium gaditjirri]|uniref:Uncharacterized protein n=1 Tax=Fusarium gaditjirri TaxID=282569 RepID=A0A8H4T0T6_9HYPO|nr:hypothetical protein FGADI_9111 [Fusarium gaditjirri]